MGVCVCHDKSDDEDPINDYELRTNLVRSFLQFTRPKAKGMVVLQPYLETCQLTAGSSEELIPSSSDPPLYCVVLPKEFLEACKSRRSQELVSSRETSRDIN